MLLTSGDLEAAGRKQGGPRPRSDSGDSSSGERTPATETLGQGTPNRGGNHITVFVTAKALAARVTTTPRSSTAVRKARGNHGTEGPGAPHLIGQEAGSPRGESWRRGPDRGAGGARQGTARGRAPCSAMDACDEGHPFQLMCDGHVALCTVIVGSFRPLLRNCARHSF